MKSFNKLWFLILLLVTGGVAAVTGSYLTRARTISQIHRMLHSHVNGVTALVKKSVSQGVWSTATIYLLYEERLITTAHLMSHLDSDIQSSLHILDAEQITVFLPTLTDVSSVERWGDVPVTLRTRFRQEMSRAPLYELLDSSLLRSQHLVCIVYESGEGKGTLCHQDASLNRMKKDTGIGPLLHELIKADLSWVVLQDADGVLAAAPSDAAISRWRDDRRLNDVTTQKKMIVRNTEINGVAHVESLSPFPMVDDSTAVLRVAVNAAVFDEITRAAHRRHYVTVILVIIIEFLLIGIVIAYQRWRKNQHEVKARLARQEEERKHWELIGGLSATVAHEVRNPLNTIGMTAERLQYEFSVPDEERADFDHLLQIQKKEATQLNKIVTDFLELGKPNQLQIEETEVGPFVAELAAHFLPRAAAEDKQIEIETDTRAVVEIDRRRFQQILTNLTNNALDASQSGDAVTIRVFEADADIVIEVSDTGVGMTDEQLAQALTPFVSFKANGTGLGLALVARLTLLHTGQFTLKKNPTKGVTAQVRIPRSRKGVS